MNFNSFFWQIAIIANYKQLLHGWGKKISF